MNKRLMLRLNAAYAVKAGGCFVFLLCLLMVSCLLPGHVSAQDPTPEPVINTIANPSGTTINLFDYYVYGTNTGDDGRFPSITYINNAGNPNNLQVKTGINDGHDLKFIQNHWSYNGDRREFQNGQIVDHPNWWNHWIGQGSNPLNPALAQGIVQQTLDENGYPV